MKNWTTGEFLTPRVLSILRIMTGLLFVEHGGAKLFGFPPMGHHIPFQFFSALGFGGALEFFGGLLVALGLLTRSVSFVLSGEMAVAYFAVHARRGFYPIVNGGELAVLYCFVFLYLSVAGGGAWSIDNLLRKPRATPSLGA